MINIILFLLFLFLLYVLCVAFGAVLGIIFYIITLPFRIIGFLLNLVTS